MSSGSSCRSSIPSALSHVGFRVPKVPSIHRVPEDVLLCVFRDVVHPPHSGRHLATLGLVCKHWREILESASKLIPGSPTLWTYLSAVDGLPHVRTALRHTGQSLLDIVYPADAWCKADALCKADAFLLLVKDKIRYWRTVDISLSESPDVLSDLQTSKLPLLETLRISNRNLATPVIDLFGEPGVSSKLTELGIRGFSVTIPLWLANLTSLSLDRVRHVTREDLLWVLQNSPNLKALKLRMIFELEPNEAIPHVTHLPSLISLDLCLPVAVMRYLLSGFRTDVASSLRLTSDMDGTSSPRGALLSDQIAHLLPTIKDLVSRAAFMEFDFYDMIGVYSIGLGELYLEFFDVDLPQSQQLLARDVFEWLAEHLGPDFRAIPARLMFYRTDPDVSHLELYGSFPHPKVVEVAIYGFDSYEGPPISVFKYLGSPRQSNPSQWPFPHLETLKYQLTEYWNPDLVEMLRGRYGDSEQIRQVTLQPPQPLKEIRIYACSGDDDRPDMEFLKEVQDLAFGTRIFWQDEVVTFA